MRGRSIAWLFDQPRSTPETGAREAGERGRRWGGLCPDPTSLGCASLRAVRFARG
jgi:hypothetical protein